MNFTNFSFKSKSTISGILKKCEFGEWEYLPDTPNTGIIVHERYGRIIYSMTLDRNNQFTYWFESEEILTMVLMEIM